MTTSRTNAPARRTRVQIGAAAVGIVFLLVGVLGFVPEIVTNYDGLKFASHESEAKLLDLFQISVLHNIVHLLFGVAGLAMARSVSLARSFLIGGGIIYLVLWIYGLLIDHRSDANFIPLNDADNWLHLILGVGMIGLGLALSRDGRQPGAAGTTTGR